MRRPARFLVPVLVVLAACSSIPDMPSQMPSLHAMLPTPFSIATALDGIPGGWHVYKLLRFKPLTQYSLVEDGGAQVVRAQANSSVSGIRHQVSVDLHQYPIAAWRWKVPKLIEGADNTVPAVADAPARVIFTFEGGRDKLPGFEQLNYDLARALTGNEMPYATLMYIWEPDRPIGEIITHHNTTRVKMIIAANSQRELNRWYTERVNVLEDYRRAFHEDPPRVKSVGIMSDSDNTGTSVVAYFGDISFSAE
ncbi:DUF3047 domain-containing protein [Usitatibacter palustris]|uniref:DUF3047 domain-containing protein n=1 Tax=Usitatibacter palustris TaxID=2732487 RepID=A0A6M4H762_9PROT|nr:DUF3047 domain-containing protein [Usitatibacter palustris]QJR13817.1 hypothetical protein DSM104440_00607 [Usitatibacter palustris]